MSTPHEPDDAARRDVNEPAAQPPVADSSASESSAAPAGDAPTEVYPPAAPASDAPTQAYPPAPPTAPGYGQAPAGYGQAPAGYGQAPAGYGQAPAGYGQAPAGYGQAPAGYAQPGYAPAPAGPDTRPKTLAWFSIGAVALGIILVLVGFVPVPWVGLIATIVGGLALVVAFILSIVVLASRKQGGKPLGIVSLVVSLIGGAIWFVALVAAIAFSVIGSSTGTTTSPSPSVSSAPSQPADDDAEPDDDAPAAGAYDETAFLDEVRPAIMSIFQEIDPSITDEVVEQFFPDSTLITTGKAVLMAGEAGRQPMIDAMVSQSQGTFTEESAEEFVDAIYTAAEKHLQE